MKLLAHATRNRIEELEQLIEKLRQEIEELSFAVIGSNWKRRRNDCGKNETI
jgi:hypothetical protein